jgi:hypothetical protein
MWSVKNVIGFALEFYLSLSVVEFKPKIVLVKITPRLYLAANKNRAFEPWLFLFGVQRQWFALW